MILTQFPVWVSNISREQQQMHLIWMNQLNISQNVWIHSRLLISSKNQSKTMDYSVLGSIVLFYIVGRYIMLQALYLDRHSEYFMYSVLCKVILTPRCSGLRTTNKQKKHAGELQKMEFQSKEYRIIIWILYKQYFFCSFPH